jgi:two-component sensor histidine kinase
VRGGVIKRIFRSRLPDRLNGRVAPWLVELVIGLSVALVLVGARLILHGALGTQAPYAFIFIGVVIAAVLGGWRSGLVTLVVGQVLVWYAVVEPRWSVAAADWHPIVTLAVASASQLLIVIVIAFYQREVFKASAEQEQQMDLLSEALREIDHRTKNNYQTVVALISLQGQQAQDPAVRQALKEAADRINAVSLASEKLALRSDNLGTVRLGDHLCGLCEQIARGLTRDGVKLRCDVPDLTAGTQKAIHISIIVNELVTNALKHAFRTGEDGEIRVSSTVGPRGVAIVIQDDGAGMSGAKPLPRSGLGTRLVARFVKQIGATHKVTTSADGTVHTILVPNLD